MKLKDTVIHTQKGMYYRIPFIYWSRTANLMEVGKNDDGEVLIGNSVRTLFRLMEMFIP